MKKRSLIFVLGVLVFLLTPAKVNAGTWVDSGANTYYTTAGGNVGIGTTTPASSLQVHLPSASDYDSSWGKLLIGDYQGSFWLGSWKDSGSGQNNMISNGYMTPLGLYRRKGGQEAWVVTNYVTTGASGNFEIRYAGAGGSDDSSMSTTRYFRINSTGTVSVKKLVVNSDPGTWPDYVFDNNYNLAELTEVEKFIAENNHLPNIPTAKEIGEQGIEVSGIIEKQLMKIEELTLYTIQQEKQIARLEEKTQSLETRLDELEKMIENNL